MATAAATCGTPPTRLRWPPACSRAGRRLSGAAARRSPLYARRMRHGLIFLVMVTAVASLAGAWMSTPRTASAAAGAGSDPPIAVAGKDGALWVLQPSGWQSLGGVLLADPAVVVIPP